MSYTYSSQWNRWHIKYAGSTLGKYFGTQTNDSFGVCTEYHSVVDDVPTGVYGLIGSISAYNTCI